MTRRSLATVLTLATVSCAPAVGGWDVAPLLARHPAVTTIPGQRIGDLIPYPAVVAGGIALVVCRFERTERPIPVRVRGADWPTDRAALAIAAVGRAVEGVTLEASGPGADRRPAIHVRSMGGAVSPGPRGLADTLTTCRVDETGEADAPVRGAITHAEIRIRNEIIDDAGRTRAPLAEEWIGAMLHELGHALGFQGHVARGTSLVQLEQSRLRRLGRRVLAGEALPAPNLSALYALRRGTKLGEARLSAIGARALSNALEAVRAEASRRGPPSGPWSTAGDREARIAWRWDDGTEVVLHFPAWSNALRWHRPVDARWLRRAGPGAGAATR